MKRTCETCRNNICGRCDISKFEIKYPITGGCEGWKSRAGRKKKEQPHIGIDWAKPGSLDRTTVILQSDITLRDFFAGCFIMGFSFFSSEEQGVRVPKPETAFEYADAMLKARGK